MESSSNLSLDIILTDTKKLLTGNIYVHDISNQILLPKEVINELASPGTITNYILTDKDLIPIEGSILLTVNSIGKFFISSTFDIKDDYIIQIVSDIEQCILHNNIGFYPKVTNVRNRRE